MLTFIINKEKNDNVSQLFIDLTGKMLKIRDALKSIKVYIPNDQNEKQINSFFSYDFGFPVFDAQFHPILPEFVDSKENKEALLEVRHEITLFIELWSNRIINKKWCLGKAVFCYFEQLEYILSYNYNAVKFEAISHDGHKVPMMFFPAHGKHMVINRDFISKEGKNVTITFDSANPEGIHCSCENNDRPTVILCNPNALWYEQMVNYPHNFWLKYFMNHGNNVVVWNYRGYGSNGGSPDPYNIKRDGEAVVEYWVNTLKLKGRMAIYGRSLGGIVACHIGRHVKGIDLLIADRTLANLDTLTKRKMFGNFINYAYNFFTCGWEVDNDINFLESTVQCKVMTCDPSDDVIDIYSSLYTGVALRYHERQRNITSKIEVLKHELYYKEDKELSTAIKEFFRIYELICLSLREEDKLSYDLKFNPGLNFGILEEIKAEPTTLNKRDIENSRKAKDDTKTRMNLKHAKSIEALQQEFGIKESELHITLPMLFNNYIQPFRNTFSSLNAGILTLYEVFHWDHRFAYEDLKLFLVYLEVYGTGRALKPSGEYVPIALRRQNSIKKIDLIITELTNINEAELKHEPNSKLLNDLDRLSAIIIDGLIKIKSYLEEKLNKDGMNKESSHLYELENHRIEYESDENYVDQENCLKNPPERHLGFVMPIRCGHRGYPKEKDKEKKALDIFLHHNAFTSRSRWDKEAVNGHHEDSD